MFTRSAALDTKQGQAIQKINEYWGGKEDLRSGRETIGIAVCKKKYKPFCFDKDNNTVERMYGCQLHHEMRKNTIQKYGPRPGWQPFGVWSLKKAERALRSDSSDSESSDYCGNGTCAYKQAKAYDDVYRELTGESEPE